ncbi:uncharacterized protein VTP21DRAFT_2588 [Calcarisporiella thermophila]|uniref:uncharacterized protein n=1 Tax=Calcarisporiella thermophila TaxID=911321 RepID=UPI003743F71D
MFSFRRKPTTGRATRTGRGTFAKIQKRVARNPRSSMDTQDNQRRLQNPILEGAEVQPSPPKRLPVDHQGMKAISEEVRSLLEKQAIEEVPRDAPGIVSNIFVISKSSGKHRIFVYHSNPVTTDALMQDWSKEQNPYANPPWALIARVLRKVLLEQVKLTLVTPHWPSAPWFPLLQQLSIAKPLGASQGRIAFARLIVRFLEFWRDRSSKDSKSKAQNVILRDHEKAGKRKSYFSAQKKWFVWCKANDVPPFLAPAVVIANFLASQYAQGKSADSSHLYRSAIGELQTSHPSHLDSIVARFLRAVDRLAPPLNLAEGPIDITPILTHGPSVDRDRRNNDEGEDNSTEGNEKKSAHRGAGKSRVNCNKAQRYSSALELLALRGPQRFRDGSKQSSQSPHPTQEPTTRGKQEPPSLYECSM